MINYMLGTFSSSPPHNCEENYLIKLSFSLEMAHEFIVLVLETFQYSLRLKVRKVMSAIVEVSWPLTFPVPLHGSAHLAIPAECILNLQARKRLNFQCLAICTEIQLVWSVDKKWRCFFQFIFSSSVEIICDFSRLLGDSLIVVPLWCDRFDIPFFTSRHMQKQKSF